MCIIGKRVSEGYLTLSASNIGSEIVLQTYVTLIKESFSNK